MRMFYAYTGWIFLFIVSLHELIDTYFFTIFFIGANTDEAIEEL